MADANDETLSQLAHLGAATNAAQNESLPPEIRAMAESAAERAAANLADKDRPS